LLQQFFKTIDGPPLVVLGIFMKWVTERDHNMDEASRPEYAKAFSHSIPGTLNMFQDRIAFDGGDGVVCEGETMDGCDYIDTRSGKQVDIQE